MDGKNMNSPDVAFVNLETGKIENERLSREIVSLFLGGRGINMYLLTNRFPHNPDHLDPMSPLILGAGLLTGPHSPSATRMNITAKSPESGLLADSNIGGFIGVALKRAGLGHVVITGKSDRPVYLYINEGRCEIHDAGHLWGKDTQETQRLLEETHGRSCQALVIGPAGENRVRFASIMHGQRSAAARGGLGCLMGSKNLKAIAISGKGTIPVFDKNGLIECAKALTGRLSVSTTTRLLNEHGTPFLLGLHQKQGILRTRGSTQNRFNGASKLLSSKLKQKYYTSPTGCIGCTVRCHHFYEIREGPNRGIKGEGPEYGMLSAFGPICGLDDLESILKLNNLVNNLGLDAISTGNLIGWAIECYEAGHINIKDTDGIELAWGNPDLVIEMVEMIAARSGFGDVLARGAQHLAEQFSPEAAQRLVRVKGLIQSDGVDVRPLKGFALGIATASRGADHLRSRPTLEIMKLPAEKLKALYGEDISSDPASYKGKARMVFQDERDYAIGDALGVCRFVQKFNNPDHLGLEEFLDLIRLASGLELTLEELQEVGERITTLERQYLVQLGIGRKDDQVPTVYLEPQPSGPHRGASIDPELFNRMLTEYYRYHGWDEENGRPTPETLKRLKLTS